MEPRDIRWLIVGICCLSALGWLVNTQDPNYLTPLVLFFFLLFLTIFSITLFVTNIVRRSLLVGGGVFVFFLLRLLGLRDWYYIMLLTVCLISLELYFQKR